MNSSNQTVVCALIFESPAGILTVSRGRFIGLPVAEIPDGAGPTKEVVQRALGSLAIVHDIGSSSPVDSKECLWGLAQEKARIFFYRFIGATIIPIGTGAAWDNIRLRDPRFDITIKLFPQSKESAALSASCAA